MLCRPVSSVKILQSWKANWNRYRYSYMYSILYAGMYKLYTCAYTLYIVYVCTVCVDTVHACWCFCSWLMTSWWRKWKSSWRPSETRTRYTRPGPYIHEFLSNLYLHNTLKYSLLNLQCTLVLLYMHVQYLCMQSTCIWCIWYCCGSTLINVFDFFSNWQLNLRRRI